MQDDCTPPNDDDVTLDDDRREFLQTTGAASLALGAGVVMGHSVDAVAKSTWKPMAKKGYVLSVKHKDATQSMTKLNDEVVKRLVNESLTRFTGTKTPGEAMQHFIKKDDVVGIKINTLGSPYASVNTVTAFTIADAVHAMGIPKNKIFIYDQYGSRMRKAKFRPRSKWTKPDDENYQVHNHKTLGYDTKRTSHNGITRRKTPGSSLFPKLLKQLTAVINVCVPKDHDLTGVTGALKNVAFGNIDVVPTYHCQMRGKNQQCVPVCRYDGVCNVARIYQHPEMGGKVRLIICDALRVLYQGGPRDRHTREVHNSMIISTDPVAVDRVILELVDDARKRNKMVPIAEDRDGRRAPRFLEAAAKLGLGEADLAKIKWEKVDLS